jgi:pyruvate kinase
MASDRPALTASELLSRLATLREECLALEREHAPALDQFAPRDAPASPSECLPRALASARNLIHYLAMRRHDLRGLHNPLAELGLSSLGRAEPHVLANLDAVITALRSLTGAPSAPPTVAGDAPVTLARSRDLLEQRTAALLGPRRRGTHIMVTLPTEAMSDESLVRALLDAGMSCARINTAHDDAEAWQRMAVLVRATAAKHRVPCRILMDLAGPKLRTGPIEAGPEVVWIKPQRDALGRVTSPGVLTLRAASLFSGAQGEAPVPDAWVEALREGDAIELTDTRDRRRLLRVRRGVDGSGGAEATTDRTTYIASSTRLRLLDAGPREPLAVVGRLPALTQSIPVREGEVVLLSLRARVATPARPGRPAVLACTLPGAFARVRVDDPVWIDDGKIGARVEAVSEDAVSLRITHCAAAGDRIREDKGINLPETELSVAGLTPQDLGVLPLAARHADMVGMSFVRDASDVRDLRARLVALGGAHVGTVLKIETRRAFENLPSLLLAALEGPSAGVMIARGDLAVEVGYDRLAEVQEEVLWLCEAAHVPVIWATQVLETMARTGRPTRAEVTDAAMGERAECVMLNKGPHGVRTVRFLDDLMRRMRQHQSKKRPMLRALGVARRFGRGQENA